MAASQGSIRLFRLAGIDVFLHWSWFLVAYIEIRQRVGNYSSPVWNVLEYLALFVIVLAHEFGHSLACRQVGGDPQRILLWPLGGVAYVNPPERPGAILWSIVAGPLVNVILVPILFGAGFLAAFLGIDVESDLFKLLAAIWYINIGLLVFNLMPVYPLDGGKILRSLLWFVFGRAWSLTIATVVGLIGIAGLMLLAIWLQSVWTGILAVFMLMNCWGSLQYALRLIRLGRAPKREGFLCPDCKSAPPAGAFWTCSRCGRTFDAFDTQAVCPHCETGFSVTSCPECGAGNPLAAWSPQGQAPMEPTQAAGE